MTEEEPKLKKDVSKTVFPKETEKSDFFSDDDGRDLEKEVEPLLKEWEKDLKKATENLSKKKF